MSFIDQGNETTTRSAGYCSAEMDFTSSSVSTDLWYGQHIEASSWSSLGWPALRCAGWPCLLLLGNGRTDKDQRRGRPKGPHNIGWPQPPPAAGSSSAQRAAAVLSDGGRLLGHTQDSIKSSGAERENPSLY